MSIGEQSSQQIARALLAAVERYRGNANGFGASVEDSLQAADRLADEIERIAYALRTGTPADESKP